MTTVQVVETPVSVNNNSPIQEYVRSPGRSNSTYFWNDSWVQTFHKSKYFKKLIVFNYFLARLTFLRLYNFPLRLYEVLKLA